MTLGFWHKAVGLALLAIAPGACSLILGDSYYIDPKLGTGGSGGATSKASSTTSTTNITSTTNTTSTTGTGGMGGAGGTGGTSTGSTGGTGGMKCAADSDCPGQAQANDCQHPACVNFACTIAFTPSGMPAAGTSNPPQVAGDCELLVCDGMGGTMNIYDSMDPASDGNECTTDTCTGPNMTSHTSVPDGMACGNGLSCKSGQCSGCTVANEAMQCSQASCNGTVLTKAQTCDAMANCNSNGTQDCAPYLCMAATNGCTSSCNLDTDCSQAGGGNYCTGANGSCLPKLAQGAACGAAASSHECQSGFCVDGVCCNTACNTACQACSVAKKQSGINGSCGNATNAVADPRGICVMSTQSTCLTDGLCNTGACEKWPSGTQCAAATCSGSTVTAAKQCDGLGMAGSCNQGGGSMACSNSLKCNAGMTACLAGCGAVSPAGDSNCTAGYCDGVGAGVCHTKIATGATACTVDTECVSAHCGTANGVCCTASCVDQGAATCGTSAACQPGTGACLDYDDTTPCSATTCAGSTLTTYTLCNGAGTCDGGASTMGCPGNFACNGNGCYAACGAVGAGDARCAAGHYCDGVSGGACQPKIAVGATGCTAGDQCAGAGVCGANGTCCAAACNGSSACNVGCAAVTGACIYSPPMTECLMGSCAGNKTLTGLSVCDGSGGCQPTVGLPDCPMNQCSADGCTQCGADNQCTAYGYCANPGPTGTCTARVLSGGACTMDNQCLSTHCNQNMNTTCQ